MIYDTEQGVCDECHCDLTVDPMLKVVKTTHKEYRDGEFQTVVTEIKCGFCAGIYA